MATTLSDSQLFAAERLARILQEIITGRRIVPFRGRYVALRFPLPLEYELGTLEYDRMLQEALNQGLLPEAELKRLLALRAIMADEIEAEVKQLEEQMETIRDGLERLSEFALPIARRRLELLKMRRDDLLSERYALLRHSAEAKASDHRARYLLPFCVEAVPERQSLWTDYAAMVQTTTVSEVQYLLEQFIDFLSGVDERTLRYLARGQSATGSRWRLMWNGSRKTATPLFPEETVHWDINKLQLTHWSSFYDSVFEHMERPDDYVINNDELLDKWVEQQAEEFKQRARELSQSHGGMGRGQRARSAEDYDEVVYFNDQPFSPDSGRDISYRDVG